MFELSSSFFLVLCQPGRVKRVAVSPGWGHRRDTHKGCAQKNQHFLFQKASALLKYFLYSLNLLGVKGKVLGIQSRKF